MPSNHTIQTPPAISTQATSCDFSLVSQQQLKVNKENDNAGKCSHGTMGQTRTVMDQNRLLGLYDIFVGITLLPSILTSPYSACCYLLF